MKLRSKIAVSAALLGAFTTANAESITFGVEIPPIASISVTQGLVVTANALRGAVASATPTGAPFVGAFTVNTNMPKWNVYFSMANNGYLVDQNGNYLKDNTGNVLPLGKAGGATVAAAGAGQVWLKFPATAPIKGTDGAATPLVNSATSTLNNIADYVVLNGTAGNTLTAVLANSNGNTCTSAKCADNGWVYATAPTLATLGLGTMIDNTNPVNAIAGNYTETLYLTLVTAY